jgi:hypothetical protein
VRRELSVLSILLCAPAVVGCASPSAAEDVPDTVWDPAPGTSSAASQGSSPALLRAPTVELPEDITARVLGQARSRTQKADSVLIDRYACVMPTGTEVLVFDSLNRWKGSGNPARPATPVDRSSDPIWAEFVRSQPNLEDYDFFGVDVSAAPVGSGIVVASRFGDEAGLQRVVQWIRRCAEGVCR